MVPSTIVGDKAGIGIGVEAEIPQSITVLPLLMPEYGNLQNCLAIYINVLLNKHDRDGLCQL